MLLFKPLENRMEKSSGSLSFAETFRYKVVYPGGVCVRISPAMDAEKSGEIIEFGAIFEATKSLVLDGVDYVQLRDGRGWVFGNKDDTEILELVEVVRVHESTVSVTDPFSFQPVLSKFPDRNNGSSRAPIRSARVEQKYWRDIKSQLDECSSFDGFVRIACDSWATCPQSTDTRNDQQKRKAISLMVSITRQSVEFLDTSGLEACLWLLVHLGCKASRAVLALVVQEANASFEQISPARRAELLDVLNEVAVRTKTHRCEVGKFVDILPDDIKSFLQRWIIIKSAAYDSSMYAIEELVESDGAAAKVQEKGCDAPDHRSATAPATAMPVPVPETETEATPSNASNFESGSWLSNFVSQISPTSSSTASNTTTTAPPVTAALLKDRLWAVVERQIAKLANPDVQFAGLI